MTLRALPSIVTADVGIAIKYRCALWGVPLMLKVESRLPGLKPRGRPVGPAATTAEAPPPRVTRSYGGCWPIDRGLADISARLWYKQAAPRCLRAYLEF